jgi:hypothetical protein
MIHENNNKPFAEIIESSLHTFVAQAWQWDVVAPFGSLVSVQTKHRSVFGIVHQITTGSMDPGRHPVAYQKTEEQLRAEQPQIFAFLRTTFSCIIIGYQEKGTIRYQLSPEPPKIHAFVEPVAIDLCKQILHNPQYLPLLFGFADHIGNVDELILALMRTQAQLGILSEQSVEQFAQSFCLLTGNDYRRLKLLLSRAQILL